jgi:hypothetical protein
MCRISRDVTDFYGRESLSPGISLSSPLSPSLPPTGPTNRPADRPGPARFRSGPGAARPGRTRRRSRWSCRSRPAGRRRTGTRRRRSQGRGTTWTATRPSAAPVSERGWERGRRARARLSEREWIRVSGDGGLPGAHPPPVRHPLGEWWMGGREPARCVDGWVCGRRSRAACGFLALWLSFAVALVVLPSL